MMLKIMEVIIGIRLAGAAISRKMVISIEYGHWKQATLIHSKNLEELW